MGKIRCIIVEDEIPAAEELKYLLSKYDFIDIIGIAHDGEKGYHLIKEMVPKAVFLDINMPAYSGIELAKLIKKLDEEIFVIFVTAYEQHAVKAFEVEAMDYILKPYDENRIDITIKRLKDRWNSKASNNEIPEKIKEMLSKLDNSQKLLKKIPCENKGKIVLIDVNAVVFCYIEGEKTFVKTKEESYYTSYTLSEIEEKTNFFRAHRSYLVNIDNIKELYSWFHGTYKLIMSDSERSEVILSRNNVKRLKHLLGF